MFFEVPKITFFMIDLVLTCQLLTRIFKDLFQTPRIGFFIYGVSIKPDFDDRQKQVVIKQ